MKERAGGQLRSVELSDIQLGNMIRYLQKKGNGKRIEVCRRNEDDSEKPKEQLVRELWKAYIEKDMWLTRMDFLKAIGKSIGLTKKDLENKENAIKALMPEYLEFLKRECPKQVNVAFLEE